MDCLRVDEIGHNNLHVDGYLYSQKKNSFLANHLNRFNNTWVGSILNFITINDIQSTKSSTRRCI